MDKVNMFFKKLIFYSMIISIFILIISNFVIEISAEELVLKKLGTKPHKAEIIVSEEFKTYTLVEEDLDAYVVSW